MKQGFAVLLCGIVLSGGLFGADISVPLFELASRGAVEDGDFGMSSSLNAKVAVSGGYKYGVSLGLGAEIPNLEKALSYGRVELAPSWTQPEAAELNNRLNNQAVLSIRFVTATIREAANTPLDISFFAGNYDDLGSGDEFSGLFGTAPLGTGLRGFFYYPDGLNGDPFFRFNGAIHSVKGTGFAFKAILGNIVPALYVYHDLSFKRDPADPVQSYAPGRYSADARLLSNGTIVKFEVFFGFTYAAEAAEVIRGGAMAWFGSGPFSLLMQAGITSYEIKSALKIDNCYFLLEPRLRLGKIGANLSFFYHPVYYQNKIIYDDAGTNPARGMADLNLRIFYGGLDESAFEAGLETTARLKTQDGESAGFWISPFVSMTSSGLRWDFALRVNPQYTRDDRELMEGFIGVRASY